jgi:membrane associated rhomboid family serine protease
MLVALNFLAFAAELAAGGSRVCAEYGLVPAHPTLGSSLTSLFMHDPSGWSHVGCNMACLAVFGLAVERAIGSLRFGCLYLASGLAGAALHVLVDPTSTDPLVGASGAIFGVLAVAAVVRPRLVGFAASFVALNVWYAVSGAGGAVSFGAHLGGFAVGALFVWAARVARSHCLEVA